MYKSFFKSLFKNTRKTIEKKPQHVEVIGVGTSNQKTREVWLEGSLKKIPAGSRILDTGAGELQYKSFCAHLNYVSQDFAQYDGTGDGRGLQTEHWDQSKLDLVCDITNIPQPDASFDAIMCIEVLEHLPAPIEALREFSRLLKVGGTLILTAPFCSFTHMAPYFFQTGYSRYFYEYWLKRFLIQIDEIQFNGNYFEFLAQEIRRLPSMAQEYANEDFSPQDHMAANNLLAALNKFSSADQGSNQFSCFDLHILCRRIAQSDKAK